MVSDGLELRVTPEVSDVHDDRPFVVTCHMAGVNTSINCIHPYRVGDRMINPINAESGQLVVDGHEGIVQRATLLVAFLRLRALQELGHLLRIGVGLATGLGLAE